MRSLNPVLSCWLSLAMIVVAACSDDASDPASPDGVNDAADDLAADTSPDDDAEAATPCGPNDAEAQEGALIGWRLEPALGCLCPEALPYPAPEASAPPESYAARDEDSVCFWFAGEADSAYLLQEHPEAWRACDPERDVLPWGIGRCELD